MDRSEVTAYTDGACKPNPGPGGWAALLRYGDGEQVLTGGEKRTTNNRMELQAAISALSALQQPSQVDLYTDSTYIKQGITAWLPGWIDRGWRRANGEPVLNVDLWRKLAALTQKHQVRWHWVRSHTGNPQNERVDRLAFQAIPSPRPARQEYKPVGRHK